MTEDPEVKRLTKAERKALAWFMARGEPASMFGAGDPELSMVKRLRDKGFVKISGQDTGRFGFTRFDISDAGRKALEQTP